jgi:hypothetical protein
MLILAGVAAASFSSVDSAYQTSKVASYMIIDGFGTANLPCPSDDVKKPQTLGTGSTVYSCVSGHHEYRYASLLLALKDMNDAEIKQILQALRNEFLKDNKGTLAKEEYRSIDRNGHISAGLVFRAGLTGGREAQVLVVAVKPKEGKWNGGGGYTLAVTYPVDHAYQDEINRFFTSFNTSL